MKLKSNTITEFLKSSNDSSKFQLGKPVLGSKEFSASKEDDDYSTSTENIHMDINDLQPGNGSIEY